MVPRLRRTGELRKPAPLLPYQHPTQEDTVELGLLPLTSKKFNITVPIPDSLPPELDGKQVPAASSVPGEHSAPGEVQVSPATAPQVGSKVVSAGVSSNQLIAVCSGYREM